MHEIGIGQNDGHRREPVRLALRERLDPGERVDRSIQGEKPPQWPGSRRVDPQHIVHRGALEAQRIRTGLPCATGDHDPRECAEALPLCS